MQEVSWDLIFGMDLDFVHDPHSFEKYEKVFDPVNGYINFIIFLIRKELLMRNFFEEFLVLQNVLSIT